MNGENVTRSDAWWLVDQLRTVKGDDGVAAASAIDHALVAEAPGVTLTQGQLQALLAVLDDPPPGLARLHVAFAP
jgi:hypothetical protein